MSVDIFEIAEKKRRKITMSTVLILACAVLALPLAAQQRGPLPPPPPGTVVPSGAPADSEKANASRQEMSSHITNEPPALSRLSRSLRNTRRNFARSATTLRIRRFSSSRNSMKMAAPTESIA